MQERITKRWLLPVFVGMLLNIAVLMTLQPASSAGFLLAAVLGYLGIAVFAWDAYANPTLSALRTTIWLLGFLFFWFLCMPAYVYLCSREDEPSHPESMQQ